MEDVVLLKGVFKDSQEKGKEYLLKLDADRLLAPCYEAIGQTPKKKRYGGWEEKEISGHSLGHFLSALSEMYTEDKDDRLREKINYIVDELDYLQKLDKTGYVSGFPRTCFDKVFSCDFTVSRFELGGSWVPWYSIHKIYAGLIDAYKFSNNKKSLDVVIKLADWAVKGTNNLSDELFSKMMYCEHGGMCDVMAELYKITKNEEYLKLSIRFIDNEIIDPLIDLKDDLEGRHANTQIPKVIGIAKLYEILKDEKYKNAARYFWEVVTNDRSYCIGGNSRDEHFEKTNTENLGVTTAETCNTYNMLKLTEHLYSWDHDVKYIEYYEKALYNHILASQDPESGMKTYYVSTKPGHFKVYCSPFDSFWCCTGTGMENPGRYNREIYYKEDDKLYVNLFISSKINYDDVEILQETDFPYGEESILRFNKGKETFLDLKIRVPRWCKENIKVTVNNNESYTEEKNGYISIQRKWNKGDFIKINFSMSLNLYTSKDDKNKIVFMHGPIVLGGALGRENFPETDIIEDHVKLNLYPDIKVPVLIGDKKDILKYIKIIDKEKLVFEIDKTVNSNNERIKLIPFYNIHHERYTLYWKLLNEEQYKNTNLDSLDYEEKLNEISIDVVIPNNQQSEIDHKLMQEKSESGYLSECEKNYRECFSKGYFSYEMKVNSNEKNYLCVTYYGSDKDVFIENTKYIREFNLYVDENLIAKERLNEDKEFSLFNKFYLIPEEVIKNKSKIRVKICADAQNIGGKVLEIRITKSEI